MTDAEDIKNQILKIREFMEKYLTTVTSKSSLQEAINTLAKEYEVIENSLSTLLNFISLQQNVIRTLYNIEHFTRSSGLEDKSYDQLKKTLRVIMIPSFTTFISNLATTVKSSDRVLLYADNPDVPGGISDKIREISDLDKELLTAIGYDSESDTSDLDIALNALIMSRSEVSNERINDILDRVNKLIYQSSDNY